nr:MAG TPA: hypothetical protein [Caudoviricetes sp.]
MSPRWCSWAKIKNLHYYISSDKMGCKSPIRACMGY